MWNSHMSPEWQGDCNTAFFYLLPAVTLSVMNPQFVQSTASLCPPTQTLSQPMTRSATMMKNFFPDLHSSGSAHQGRLVQLQGSSATLCCLLPVHSLDTQGGPASPPLCDPTTLLPTRAKVSWFHHDQEGSHTHLQPPMSSTHFNTPA